MAEPNVVHGSEGFHEMEDETGSINEKGIGTGTRSFRVPTLVDCRDWSAPSHPLGWLEKKRTWSYIGAKLGYKLIVHYEGGYEDEDNNDYSMDISFSEEPIEAHPNLEKIKEEYRGTVDTEGRVKFAEFLEDEGQTAFNEGTGKRKNPMFGVSSWLALKATFTHTYNSSKPPKLKYINSIVDGVPGGFDTPEDHDWLVMPPKTRRNGRGPNGEVIYRTAQKYLMSPLGGWPREVHDVLGNGLSNNDEDVNDGLETGSVQGAGAIGSGLDGFDTTASGRQFGEPVNPSGRTWGQPGGS